MRMGRSVLRTVCVFCVVVQLLGLMLVVPYAGALQSIGGIGVARRTGYDEDVCSKNMPCGWAICVWTAMLSHSEQESCRVIKNTGCRCLAGHECAIDLDSMEPTSYDQPYIKYEYLCRKRSRIMAMLTSK